MPAIDFTGIPQANNSGGDQDTFELFARDFLEKRGFQILQGPDRGPDGGRDLIAEERRSGLTGDTSVRWLVSCKHYAHSGKAVGTSKESSILDRVKSSDCDGFLGFYSTLPSNALEKRVAELESNNEIETKIYDREYIEDILLKSREMYSVAKRYTPESFVDWRDNHSGRSDVFVETETVECKHCGKDLLDPPQGIIVTWKQNHFDPDKKERVIDIYASCKGECDMVLKHTYTGLDIDATDLWEDIQDVCVPGVFFRWMMTSIKRLNSEDIIYSPRAMKELESFFKSVFSIVSREMTDSERERMKRLEYSLDVYKGLVEDN